MMSSGNHSRGMTIDVMPVVSEGDELVSLADVLQSRDKCFVEDELWALCLETCKALQGLHSSSEAFQLLFVTPDSIAFDSGGRVCFLENVPDEPELLYVAPEYEAVGHSFKSHLYSLGVSMWYAAEYSTTAPTRNSISEDLNAMVAEMTKDRYEERPELTKIARQCKQKMRGKDTREICKMHAILAGRMSRASSVAGCKTTNSSSSWDGRNGGSLNLKKANAKLTSVLREETNDETTISSPRQPQQQEKENQKEVKTGEKTVSLDVLRRNVAPSFEETVAVCKESILALMRETSSSTKRSSGRIESIDSKSVVLGQSGVVHLNHAPPPFSSSSSSSSSPSSSSTMTTKTVTRSLTSQLVESLLPWLRKRDGDDDAGNDDDDDDWNKLWRLFTSFNPEIESDSNPKLTDFLRLANEIVYKRGVNSNFSCRELFERFHLRKSTAAAAENGEKGNGDAKSEQPKEIIIEETDEGVRIGDGEEDGNGAADSSSSPKLLQSSFDSSSSIKSFLQNEKAAKSPTADATTTTTTTTTNANKTSTTIKTLEPVRITEDDVPEEEEEEKRRRQHHHPHLVMGSAGAFKPIVKVLSNSASVLPSKPVLSISDVVGKSSPDEKKEEREKSSAAAAAAASYPDAFKSKSTHFKPIVVNADRSSKSDDGKDEDKNKVNINLQELKKNILKKHASRNSWFDAVEKDARENDASEISTKRETLQRKIVEKSSNPISHVSKFVGSKALRIEKTPPNMSNAAEMDPSSLTYRLELDENTGEYLLKPIFTSAKKSRPKRSNNKKDKSETADKETNEASNENREEEEKEGKDAKREEATKNPTHENHHDVVVAPPSSSSHNQLPSPSLSKDSGIGSLSQHQKLINQKVAEAAKTSIMERFFNSQRGVDKNDDDDENGRSRSQKSKSEIDEADSASISELPQLPRIIHRIRDEFGNGLMGNENEMEELSIAEYIFNLRKLKPPTFNAAITEKYGELEWNEEILKNLYEIVHSGLDSHSSSSVKLAKKKVNESSSVSESVASKTSVADTEKRKQNWEEEEPRTTESEAKKDRSKVKSDSDSDCDFSLGEITLEEKSPGHLSRPVKSCLELLKDESEDPILKMDIDNLDPFLTKTDPRPPTVERSESANKRNEAGLKIDAIKSRRGIPEFVQDGRHPPPRSIAKNPILASPHKADSSQTSTATFPSKGSETSPRSLEALRPPSRASSLFSQGGGSLSQLSYRTAAPHLTHSRSSSAMGKSPSPNFRNSLGLVNDASPLIPASARVSLRSSMPVSKLSRNGRGSVIFVPTDLRDGFLPFVNKYTETLDGLGSSSALESSIRENQRQLFDEKRNVVKISGQLKALEENDATKQNSSTFPKDTKTFQSRLKRQIEGHRQRIKELEKSIWCLYLLHVESSGLHHSLLSSFSDVTPSKPFQLMPRKDNPRLEIEIDASGGLEKVVAGTPQAFISYLYAKGSLRNGFVHHFFYVYRYLLTPIQLYNALLDRFMSALSPLSGVEYLAINVVQRTMDLLQIWVDCFHSVDFQETSSNSPPSRLLDALSKLVKDQLRPLSSEFADRFLRSLDEFRYGRRKVEMQISDSLCSVDSAIEDATSGFPSSFSSTNDENFTATAAAIGHQKWASLVPTAFNAEGDSRTRLQDVTSGFTSCIGRKKQDVVEDVYFGASVVEFSDGFTLADYSVQTLAAVLTSMQQECFRQIDPVDILDTKSIGIVLSSTSTSKLNPTKSQQPSLELILTKPSAVIAHGASATDAATPTSVFVSPRLANTRRIVSCIRHSQMVSHWAASELLTCSSLKIQMATLTKFISVAKLCYVNGDLASCAALAEALQSLMVKQLPAWRSLPTRTIGAWDRVLAVKKSFQNSVFFLRDFASSFISSSSPNSASGGGKEYHLSIMEENKRPILPPICHVVAHVQEIEAKGFIIVASPGNMHHQSNAEQKFSWAEFKVLAEIVDQIRKCRRIEFQYLDLEESLVEALKQRILRMSDQDVVSLASKNEVNFALKMPSDSKIHSALKNVKGIFKGSSKE